jgi:hypothetical protein
MNEIEKFLLSKDILPTEMRILVYKFLTAKDIAVSLANIELTFEKSAMGGLGSDAAIETADIVIRTDQPSKIATAIKIRKPSRSSARLIFLRNFICPETFAVVKFFKRNAG